MIMCNVSDWCLIDINWSVCGYYTSAVVSADENLVKGSVSGDM